MRRSWSSREVIQVLRSEGWYFTDAVGDHYHFRHAVKTGKATVTHPKKDVSRTVLDGIEAVTWLKF